MVKMKETTLDNTFAKTVSNGRNLIMYLKLAKKKKKNNYGA